MRGWRAGREVGEELGVCKERIFQLKRKALRMLRATA